ncbi:hypothetical protein PLICRDRAFT_138811 [Plicaturopsis crispa FD-325 SS-3]|nr:hypothetical protein PLICRDRAFT_138811 [Plicaturopsis crispa FD-325 SS-3]
MSQGPRINWKPDPNYEAGTLTGSELWWRDHYAWLKERGYLLRSRYSPDWVPSWKGTSKRFWECEDSKGPLIKFSILDATRTADGAFVTLKQILKSETEYEVDVGRYLSSEPLASDPRNHSVPFWDVIDVPDDDDIMIIVMPLLKDFDDPMFDTFGEAVECFRQLIEGLQFLHEHHIAHRDIMSLNFMMDATPLYPEPYHPHANNMKRDWSGKMRPYTRTQRPVKYYYIDFGFSRRYSPGEHLLEMPLRGGVKTVPEFQTGPGPFDPFPTDIWYLGEMIRSEFMEELVGFDFMQPLVVDMIQDDPVKRPDIHEVAARFEVIRRSLSRWKLRSRVYRRDRSGDYERAFTFVRFWFRRLGLVIRRVPPIPTPKAQKS